MKIIIKKKNNYKKKKLKYWYLGIKKLLWSQNIQIENITREAKLNYRGCNLTVKKPLKLLSINNFQKYLKNKYV